MDDGSIIISIQNLYYRFYLIQNKIHHDTLIKIQTKLRKLFKEAPLKQLTYLADVYKHTFLSNGVSSFQAIALSDCFLLSFSDNTDTQVSSNTRVFSYHG